MRAPFSYTPLVLSLLAISVASGAYADDAAVALPTIDVNASGEGSEGTAVGYQGKPATGTTRLNLTAHETPQGVTTIKREQLEDFKLNSIRDVLTSTPGVNVQKVETDRTYFTARGFDINNIQYDGTGMPLMSGLLVGDIDMAPFEQVDILHGANGLMTGNGNPSATVNLVRKRPTYTPQAQVDMTVGAWDKRRVDLDVSGPLTESGNVRGRVIYANENGNSYLDRYSREKNIFSGLLAFDLSERDTLTVGYENQKSDANAASWGALPLVDGNGNKVHYSSTHSSIAQPWVYWDVHTQRAFGEWEHTFDNAWTSKLTITGVEHREDTEMFYIYGAGDGYTGLGSKYKDKNTELDGDLAFTGPFSLAGREHQLTFGANWARSRNRESSQYGDTLNYAPVSLEDALAGNLPRPIYNAALPENTSRYTDRQKSVYAGARFSLADDLHLITGARMLSADSDGESYDTPREVRVHGKVTPYAGLVYDLTPQYALYASYAEIYNPQYSLDTQGRVLDPLEGKSYEAGIKGQLMDKKLDVSAAVFHTKQDNVAAYAGYDASLGGSVYEGTSYDSSGVELSMAGELAPGLQVNGGYTYVYITDDNDSRARRFIPRHAFNSSVTYRLPGMPKVKVGGSLKWQSEVAYDTDTTARQDGYALVGLMARYDIDAHWSTQLNLDNLTNEKYLQSLRYGQSNYGEPRNITASVSWKL
ncbi:MULTISPECIES: TonB-dependent siderophore receptor [Pseudomonas]|uniref:TonB-dependent siderophore receptor n=1 Tax=Pseudomonas quercus TaxID=2722792 RepID=A0ABX0YCU2_9PSED|nr:MULTISPECIES: TonB-dependent siderophore receptor [Pseudomonas]MBF7142222.1 TonB-dependent siderophore receptor [Pseudomonas sp. LY10J]NJP00760.1 TonB-dependent siderophore receptor [Pseudomonas quercus]